MMGRMRESPINTPSNADPGLGRPPDTSTIVGERPQSWQQALANAVRQPEQLFELLALPRQALPAARRAARLFPLRVPRAYLSRIQTGCLDDPLLRQVLPIHLELTSPRHFVDDPVGDHQALRGNGLLQKYRNRALIITTSACAIHCRYCFRRHFPYADQRLGHQEWHTLIDSLSRMPDVNEIILSGGDPLTLSTARLQTLTSDLATLPSIRTLRIHTRLPVVLPDRIDEALCHWLSTLPFRTVMVIHCNHAQEIDESVRQALSRLSATGVTLLNQAVLMRGVNDTLADQISLHTSLFEQRVIPYYLHMLDRVRGSAHFEVPETQAGALLEQMRQHLPGYLVPRLVREVAGAAYKVPLR